MQEKKTHTSPLTFRACLEKLGQLSLLSLLFSVPLIYPLKIHEQTLNALVSWFEKKGPFLKSLWDWQLEPYLYFGLSPLLLKWIVAQGYILFFVGVFILWKMTGPGSRGGRRLTLPYILTFALLAYAGISTLFISPTIHYSMRAFITLVVMVLFFVATADFHKSPSFVVKSMIFVGIVSFLLCVVAFMQHLHLTDPFMLRFDRMRNRMGAFIGHNTGLSSFLMPSLFLSIAALTTVKSKVPRIALTIYLVLLGFILVTAQSRGVILILVFLLPLYLFYLKKTTGLPLPFRWLITAFLVFCIIILVQLVNHPWNIFYSPEAPLVKRVEAFKPEYLRGTRLRILTCSRELLRESPAIGHGFNSFQYVYPKAQADYYESHPDTLLMPTDLRTQRAHNEYLQIAIELGFAGLAVILFAIYLFLRRGQDVFLSIEDTARKRLLCAIFFSITAYLIHAFMDFPFQITPLCLLFLFFLAVWVSGGHTWKEKKPDEESGETPSPASRMKNSFPGRIALIAIPLILFLAILPLANALILRPFRSDLLFFKADMYIQTFHQYPDISTREKMDLLNRAVSIARQANRMDPLNAELRFKLGEAYYLLGTFYTDQWKAAKKTGNEKLIRTWHHAAVQNLSLSGNWLRSALEEFRFHSVYYLIGVVEEILERLDPGKGHLSKARENYSIAVRYSPALAPALKDYSELLLKISRDMPEVVKGEMSREILRLRRLIAKNSPEYFDRHFLQKPQTAMLKGDYKKAIALLIDLMHVQPDNVLLRGQLATALTTSGKPGEAVKVLSAVKGKDRDNPDILDAWVMALIKLKDYEKALSFIQKRLTHKLSNNNIFEVFELLTLEKLGRDGEAGEKRGILLEKAKEDPKYLQILGMASIEYFDDPEKGIKYLEERIEREPRPASDVYYLLARGAVKRGEISRAEQYLERALEILPGETKAKNLLESIRESGEKGENNE